MTATDAILFRRTRAYIDWRGLNDMIGSVNATEWNGHAPRSVQCCAPVVMLKMLGDEFVRGYLYEVTTAVRKTSRSEADRRERDFNEYDFGDLVREQY